MRILNILEFIFRLLLLGTPLIALIIFLAVLCELEEWIRNGRKTIPTRKASPKRMA